ncbi:hypothetical protein KDX31_03195 [Amphritea atlantica]|uniref:Uncharacterized protein n=1 Tax=Amphritea atlantica TaxID=355243 RepID=A0ABY5GXM7_9GAMM|nr:hypothetical protein KDX31_03195 [Amphritea atlantica]
MQNASAFRAIATITAYVYLGVTGGMNSETGGVRDVVVIAFTEKAGE